MPHPLLISGNRIPWSRLLIYICLVNGKQYRSRSVGFFRSQLIWIYSVCKGKVISGFSRTRFNTNPVADLELGGFIGNYLIFCGEFLENIGKMVKSNPHSGNLNLLSKNPGSAPEIPSQTATILHKTIFNVKPLKCQLKLQQTTMIWKKWSHSKALLMRSTRSMFS